MVLPKIRSWLEYKIFLVVSSVLIVALGTYLVITIQHGTETLLRQYRGRSRVYTGTLMSRIRNVMLAGKGSFARSLATEARISKPLGTSACMIGMDVRYFFAR